MKEWPVRVRWRIIFLAVPPVIFLVAFFTRGGGGGWCCALCPCPCAPVARWAGLLESLLTCALAVGTVAPCRVLSLRRARAHAVGRLEEGQQGAWLVVVGGAVPVARDLDT